MTRRAYINARLIDPASGLDAPGGLIVDGGRIVDVGPRITGDGLGTGVESIDCGGHVLAPALIDARVHAGEPGAEHKETLATAGAAAAAGGIGTIVLQPATDPVIDEVPILEFVLRRGRITCPVRVEAMAALTKGRDGTIMAEMGLLRAAGAVGFTDGERTLASAQTMRRALAYARTVGAIVVAHAEEPTLATGVMNEGEISSHLGLPGRPAAAELIAIERDLRLVAITGGRYHLAQVSSAAALPVLAAAKHGGLPVTVGVSAPHLALNELDVLPYRTFFKLRPPLRTEDDRAALVEAVRDGLIDVIASSHMPQDEESKRLPFDEAAYGAAGLETLLPVVLGLHHSAGISLVDALRPVTSGPAALFGLSGGRLAKDAPADLVLIDLDAPWVCAREDLRSKSTNTPFEGRKFTGRALWTVVGGETVFARDTA